MNPYIKNANKDYRTKVKNIETKYDASQKAIAFSCNRIAMVPAYAYYLCEHLETVFKAPIVKVIFLLDASRAYYKEELKGIENWDELDLKDQELTGRNPEVKENEFE